MMSVHWRSLAVKLQLDIEADPCLRAAFTRIELLVVITMIPILVAPLLPPLSRAKVGAEGDSP